MIEFILDRGKKREYTFGSIKTFKNNSYIGALHCVEKFCIPKGTYALKRVWTKKHGIVLNITGFEAKIFVPREKISLASNIAVGFTENPLELSPSTENARKFLEVVSSREKEIKLIVN